MDVRELEDNVAPFIPTIDDDELAKRFDYLMYTIKYADLKRVPASKPKNRVVTTAEKVIFKGSIDKVKKQESLIYRVQTMSIGRKQTFLTMKKFVKPLES